MEADFYEKNAETLFKRYQSLDPEQVHSSWLHLLPNRAGMALDVGGGSGRDAAWLASKGWEVIVIEPSIPLMELGRAASSSNSITWIDDSLPRLAKLDAYQNRFLLILVSAVLMHLPPQQRSAAFDTLFSLLAARGMLVITLRHGPSSDERKFYSVPPEEIVRFAATKKLSAIILDSTEDQLQRHEVTWHTVIIQNSVNT